MGDFCYIASIRNLLYLGPSVMTFWKEKQQLSFAILSGATYCDILAQICLMILKNTHLSVVNEYCFYAHISQHIKYQLYKQIYPCLSPKTTCCYLFALLGYLLSLW